MPYDPTRSADPIPMEIPCGTCMMRNDDTEQLACAPEPLRTAIVEMRVKLLTRIAFQSRLPSDELLPGKVSIHGARCALLLEEWFKGLHHLPKSASSIDWSRRFVELDLFSSMATFDFDEMTTLVILAHKHCIRAELQPDQCPLIVGSQTSKTGFVLLLHPRTVGSSLRFSRHPSLSDLWEKLKKAGLKNPPR